LIFIRGIDEKFSLHKELASVSSLHSTTTEEDLFTKVKETFISLGLNWGTLKSVKTDRVKKVYCRETGADRRIISEVMQEISDPPMTFHCIIHQQVLCSKVLRWNSFKEVIISTLKL
jgi:hypothetical protein